MKIYVKTKPKAREEKVIKIDDAHFEVSVKEPPIDGRANWGIMRALALYFDVPPTDVNIISGHTSRQKVVEIDKMK
jgi:uncharacterized protein